MECPARADPYEAALMLEQGLRMQDNNGLGDGAKVFDPQTERTNCCVLVMLRGSFAPPKFQLQLGISQFSVRLFLRN